MRRGDLITVAAPGDYGKPHPAVVIQSDALEETASVLVCLLTTTRRPAPFTRLPIDPSAHNGLRDPSDVMGAKRLGGEFASPVIASRLRASFEKIGALRQRAAFAIRRDYHPSVRSLVDRAGLNDGDIGANGAVPHRDVMPRIRA